jgi:hypothetical protein
MRPDSGFTFARLPMSLKRTTLCRAAVSFHDLVLIIMDYRIKLCCCLTRSLLLMLRSMDTKDAGQQPDCLGTLRFRGAPARNLITPRANRYSQLLMATS